MPHEELHIYFKINYVDFKLCKFKIHITSHGSHVINYISVYDSKIKEITLVEKYVVGV